MEETNHHFNSDEQPAPKAEMEHELDASLEADIDLKGPSQVSAMNLDGPSETNPAGRGGLDPVVEARATSKKDTTLRELLGKMDEYAPIIPDAVTSYYLVKAGLPPPPQTPIQLARLIALATQKFVADVAADAYQYSRIRASNTSSNNPIGGLGGGAGTVGVGGGASGQAAKDGTQQQGKGGNILGIQRPGYGGGGQGGTQGRTVLTMEDLGMAVGEYGVNVQRPEFYRG